MAFCQFAIFGDNAEFLLSRECFLAQLVPTLVELAFILIGPLLGHVVRKWQSQ
jgi:hypothetical protein